MLSINYKSLYCIDLILFFIFLLSLIKNNNLLGQSPLYIKPFDYAQKNALHDFGYAWDEVSSIGAFNYNNYKNIKNSSAHFEMIPGILFENSNSNINLTSDFSFNKMVFGYFISDVQYINRNYKRISVSKSGFGIYKDWVNLQIGRGNENWAAGKKEGLALSRNSKPYEYLKLSSNYGNLRVNYIHGFLEKVESNFNRYINARGIEWTNKQSLIIGLSETVIYSGPNRSFDFAYINPIGSHLEIEQNGRLGAPGFSSANAVWQLHIDYLLFNKHRISINYLIDEFVLDPEIEINKEHGSAFSYKLSSPLISNEEFKLSLYYSYFFVGTPTFRHSEGENNFVNKEFPIGWENGSDGTQRKIGFTFLDINKMVLDFSLNLNKWGEESITNRPYDEYPDYIKGSFPSGNISSSQSFQILCNLKVVDSFHLMFNQEFISETIFKGYKNFFQLAINLYFIKDKNKK